MNIVSDSAPINALDPRGVSNLQRLAKTGDPAALKAAAKQFEALFLQMVLKSMRDATPREGLFDSDQSRMYESLLDQQLSQVLASKRGTGLAEVIERQLRRSSDPETVLSEGVPLDPVTRSFLFKKVSAADTSLPANSTPVIGTGLDAALAGIARGDGEVPEHVRQFVGKFLPDANRAAAATGIPPAFLLAHAALESGWGKSEPRFSDGRPSYNLFGIKAQGSWSGEKVTASTTEVIQGVAQRRHEPFRVYGSYAEGFADYARLLADNPRYAGVVGSKDPEAFANGLQQAGYATDPNYARKLKQVLETML